MWYAQWTSSLTARWSDICKIWKPKNYWLPHLKIIIDSRSQDTKKSFLILKRVMKFESVKFYSLCILGKIWWVEGKEQSSDSLQIEYTRQCSNRRHSWCFCVSRIRIEWNHTPHFLRTLIISCKILIVQITKNHDIRGFSDLLYHYKVFCNDIHLDILQESLADKSSIFEDVGHIGDQNQTVMNRVFLEIISIPKHPTHLAHLIFTNISGFFKINPSKKSYLLLRKFWNEKEKRQ